MLDPASGERVDACFDRLTIDFHNALRNAQRSGEIRTSADVDELAAFFTMALIGIAALAKGRAQPNQIRAACRLVADTLKTHAADETIATQESRGCAHPPNGSAADRAVSGDGGCEAGCFTQIPSGYGGSADRPVDAIEIGEPTMPNPAEPFVAGSADAQRAMLDSSDPRLAADNRLVWDMWREIIQGGHDDMVRRVPHRRRQDHRTLGLGDEDVRCEQRVSV